MAKRPIRHLALLGVIVSVSAWGRGTGGKRQGVTRLRQHLRRRR